MKKFIFITLVVLLAGLFVFHFIAANQAENQIDKAIQMQADSSANKYSIQYSAIDISPFSGDINFNDVTVVEQTNIERAGRVHINLRYIDFLNIYLRGIEYGLKQLTTGNMEFTNVSHVNRTTMQEYALATADVEYSGNMWDAIRSLFMKQPLSYQHQFDIRGTQLRYSKPSSSIGTFKSDSVSFQLHFSKNAAEQNPAENSMHFQDITWDPPAWFQDKYGFFIQGFGYPLDAIPLEKMGFSFSDVSRNRIQINSGQTETDLFTITFEGTVVKDSTWSASRLAPLQLTVRDLSPEFNNVISNLEKLLGITIPRNENQITFQLAGPITNPKILHNN